jgi:hypothetical protein
MPYQLCQRYPCEQAFNNVSLLLLYWNSGLCEAPAKSSLTRTTTFQIAFPRSLRSVLENCSAAAVESHSTLREVSVMMGHLELYKCCDSEEVMPWFATAVLVPCLSRR